MPSPIPLRVGARVSALSRIQADIALKALSQHKDMTEKAEFIGIQTSADKHQDCALSDIGGKRLFCKEIDQAVLENKVDFAVHSIKDMETPIPEGLSLTAVLPRHDSRDSFVSFIAKNIEALPKGAVFGTSSPRRTAQIRRLRPDLKIVLLRGNVESRLKKLETGKIDATIMAAVGIKRLELSCPSYILEHEVFLPAVAQGAIGLVTRKEETALKNLIRSVNDPDSEDCISCERAMLYALGGSCFSPVAAHAQIKNDVLHFRTELYHPETDEILSDYQTAPRKEAVKLGKTVGAYLRQKAAHFPIYFFSNHAPS